MMLFDLNNDILIKIQEELAIKRKHKLFLDNFKKIEIGFTSVISISVISIRMTMTATPLSGMGIGIRACIVVVAGIVRVTDYSS